MTKNRANGEGNIRKRKDGRWEGRIVVGHKENGDSIFRYIYADSQKEQSGWTAGWNRWRSPCGPAP